MIRPHINLAPAALLATVTLLFALTWSNDTGAMFGCGASTSAAIVAAGERLRQPAVGGLLSTGRSALQQTISTLHQGDDDRLAATPGEPSATALLETAESSWTTSR